MMEQAPYLFTWNKVPGIETPRVSDHLRIIHQLPWIQGAAVRKSLDMNSIILTEGSHSIFFRLDEERRVVTLHLEDGIIHEYRVLKEKNALKVYVTEIPLILRELDSFDLKSLDALASSIIQRSRKEAQDLVNVLHSKQEEEKKKAALVLQDLGDLAVTPLLDTLSPEIPKDYVWDVVTIVNLYLELRQKILKELAEMLTDPRPVPVPELGPNVEEQPAPRRICDEAFLLLRKMLYLDENEEVQFFNGRNYLNMSDEERDAEIVKMTETKIWSVVKGQVAGY